MGLVVDRYGEESILETAVLVEIEKLPRELGCPAREVPGGV
jgi:hypothetical protein